MDGKEHDWQVFASPAPAAGDEPTGAGPGLGSKQTISNWEVGRKVPRMKAIEKIANVFGVSRNSILAGLPVEILEQEGRENRKVVDLTDRDVRLTYLGQQVPREYIDIIEKLMRCDISERDAQ